jgi:serine/threonine-protein kinase
VFQPGDILAEKYKVERVLGQGGMGVVLAARHLQLGDLVAIKLVLPELVQQSELMERFGNEARVARMLKSPHAGKVLDFGVLEPDNAPFIVMEYLEGRDLSRVLAADGPLPLTTAVDYVLQACVALAEAHSFGIVHRDIKPSNLFLTFGLDGHPVIKVLDFGIAKVLSNSQPQLTNTRGMMGSVLYASPEQLESAKNVDGRTDIWSLGVAFFELLTGQFPFMGDDIASIAVQVFSKPAKGIRELRPELPIAFEAIMARWLAKNRDERFPNISELSKTLAPYGTALSQSSLYTVLTISTRPPAMLTPLSVPSASTPATKAFSSSGVAATAAPAIAPTAPMPTIATAGTVPPSVDTAGFLQPQKRPRAPFVTLGAVVAGVAIVVFSIRYFSSPSAQTSQSAAPAQSTSALENKAASVAATAATSSETSASAASVSSAASASTPTLSTTGTLSITTSPPGTCTVNGVSKGKAPLTLTVPVGQYAIACVAANHATGAQSVKVVAGKISAISLSLVVESSKPNHPANCNPAVDICE